MMLQVKICGITTAEARDAAIEGGAAFLGFVFFPPSPRFVEPPRFGKLAAEVPPGVATVGVFVDPAEEEIEAVLEAGRLDILQLHGTESPGRLEALRARYALPVMKAVRIGTRDDLAAIERFRGCCDLLLFDARPPAGARLPGGNAAAFDWRLLAGVDPGRPWFLAGGLDAGNVARAVRVTGARRVDVSSGVERRPGVKDPAKIRAFLAAVRALAEGEDEVEA